MCAMLYDVCTMGGYLDRSGDMRDVFGAVRLCFLHESNESTFFRVCNRTESKVRRLGLPSCLEKHLRIQVKTFHGGAGRQVVNHIFLFYKLYKYY